MLNPKPAQREDFDFFRVNTAQKPSASDCSIKWLFIPQGFMMNPSKAERDFSSSSKAGWRHRPGNQGRAAHRLPGSWNAQQNSSFSVQIYKPEGGKGGRPWPGLPQLSITPALPFPRHPPLPTAGSGISLADNYRVKCQPHSQEHHYPLAN